MDFRWTTALWKGLRPALVVALAAGASAFANTLTPETFVSIGVPAAFAVFIVETARNFVKQTMLRPPQ